MSSGSRLHHLVLGVCLGLSLLVPLSLKAEEAPVEKAPAAVSGADGAPESAPEGGNVLPPIDSPQAQPASVDASSDVAANTSPSEPAGQPGRVGDAQNEAIDVARLDLAAQQSMAESTISLVATAWLQVGIGIAALLLLALTIYYTKRAAVHAEGANTEAKRHADLAALAMLRFERPYLFLKVTSTSPLRKPGPSHPFIEYRFVNHGRMPATVRSIAIRLAPSPELPLRLPLAAEVDVYEVIEPDAAMDQRQIGVAGSRIGQGWADDDATKLVLYGSVKYEDPYGGLHIDRFCFRCTKNAQTFVLEGGEEYNQRTSVGPTVAIDRAVVVAS